MIWSDSFWSIHSNEARYFGSSYRQLRQLARQEERMTWHRAGLVGMRYPRTTICGKL